MVKQVKGIGLSCLGFSTSLLLAFSCGAQPGESPSVASEESGSGSDIGNAQEGGEGDASTAGSGTNGNGDDPGEAPDTGVGTQPCKDYETGYAGDEFCLEAPDPSVGFQLHYGPKDYDDPEEVAKYLIYPGEETTDCFFLKTPNDEERFLAEYHGRMRPGSHHMITYTEQEDHPDSVAPETCNQGPTSRFLVGAQSTAVDIMPDDNAPEHQGYAMKIGKNMQAAIQLHYINTTDKPFVKESWINVVYADPDKVTTLIEPIFWIGGLDMAVPPHSKEIIRGECKPPADAPEDLHLLNVTGHYHAHTVRFSAWLVPADGEDRTLIYESYTYNDPGITQFDSITQNPVPDPEAGTPGGLHNGPLEINQGDKVEWECEVHNTSDHTLRFANGAYTAEMCNMFGMYAPSLGRPWACYNF